MRNQRVAVRGRRGPLAAPKNPAALAIPDGMGGARWSGPGGWGTVGVVMRPRRARGRTP
jgi:hypothetical protein